MLDARRGRAARTVLAMTALATLVAGCADGGGGGGPADAAMATVVATAAENNDHLVYALDVASRGNGPRTGKLLLDHAGDTPYDVAHTALHGLAERTVTGGAEALRPVFEQKRGTMKIAAALALANQGDDAGATWLAENLADVLQAGDDAALVYLATHGHDEAVFAALQQAISSDDERRRDTAYLVLGGIGSERARTLLAAGLDREHGERRQTAIVAIGRTGDAALVPKIDKFVNTQGLVTATIEALGRLGGPRAIEKVAKLASHEEALVRAYAVEALLRSGAGEDLFAPALDGLVADADAGVRQLIALRLGGVDHPAARSALAALAADPEREVRLEAMRSLLVGASAGEIDLFVTATGDADYQVQAVAIEALGRVAGPDVVGAKLEPLLAAEIPYVRIAAGAAIAEILDRAPAAS